uniref:DNA repair protein rad-50 n=2 Tax=Ascaris TaxID=6251 RepID=F1KRQ5_ASCSU
MSLLDTIDIQGIRSIGVGPQNAIVIEFLTPLTIICGPNGSGKTTIIEALKYATTNELPSGKMPTFIHDYRLAGKTRIDASVKLKFKDIRGRASVVTRRMTARAEGAKSKLTTRSEESTIAIETEPDEWKSLSSKVIDCKKEVLNLLGVPAAILEYVVFCHQEESTWPLDEPKKLKERFDEIFQVTGYVKAIELLKKEMKENKSQLQISHARLPLLIEQQNRKVELHNEYIELKGRYEKAEKELTGSEAMLTKLKHEWDDLKGKLADAAKRERECESLRTECRILQEQYDGCTVQDYQGSIDDLQREIEKVSQSAEFLSVEKERNRIEQQISDLSSKMQQLQAEKEQLDHTISQLRAVQMLRENLTQEKIEAISTARRMFNLDEHGDFSVQLKGFEENCNAEFSQFQRNYEESMRSCQKGIDVASVELARIRSELGMKDAECTRLAEAIRNMNAELGETTSSQQEMEKIEEEIRNLEEDHNRLDKDVRGTGKVEKLKEERDEIALKISRLQAECRERQNEEDVEGELKRAVDEERKLEEELKELAMRHVDALKEIFGDDSVSYPLGERLALFVRKLDRTATAAEEEYQEREKKQIAAQNRLEQISRDIEQITQQIATHKRNISKVISAGEDAENKLAEVSTLLTKTRNDLGQLDGCRYLYEKWEEEVRKTNCCPLCDRKYGSTQEASQLATKVNRKRAELPDEIERLQRRVREYEETQNELMEVVPYVKIVKRLSQDKEELESDFKVAEKKLHTIGEEVINARNDREKTLKKKEAFRSVQADASLMDKTWNTLSEKQREIKRLKAEVDVCDGVERRSLAELRAELEQYQHNYNDLIASIDEAQASISERNNLIEKLNVLRERRVELMEKSRQHDRLIESLKEKQNNLDERRINLKELNTKLPIVEAELQAKLAERETTQTKGKGEESRLVEIRRAIDAVRAQIGSIEKRMEGSKGDVTELKMKEGRLSELKSKIVVVDEKIRSLNGDFDNVNTKQERKRRLDEQLKKLELAARIKSLNENLEQLRWDGKPVVELLKEEQRLQRACNETSLEMERTRGEMGQQKKRITEMKEKLNSRDFLKSEEDFKKEVITKCVTEKVIEDLEIYIRAMDESIVEFHAKKMEEINEVLASLWEKVYRGCDVEKVQIKSESVDETERRKSYNYRVVMFMDGKEIDMPGRCSAGQKMLASILIRIALSDVFCDKCSIIALDEPTTNLDVLKVENLGDMLAEVIEERSVSSQKAFQLIVITHDYRFVEHLRQLCRPEWVYSLTKDTDGLSRIKRHRNILETVVRED